MADLTDTNGATDAKYYHRRFDFIRRALFVSEFWMDKFEFEIEIVFASKVTFSLRNVAFVST